MEKFIIKKIEADFDERWLRVKKIDDGKEFGIYFMEFSEDVFMMNNISMKRKVGDIIEGNLFIAWITEFERTNEELMYVQKNEYSGIDAVVEITEVINEFTYYAKFHCRQRHNFGYGKRYGFRKRRQDLYRRKFTDRT